MITSESPSSVTLEVVQENEEAPSTLLTVVSSSGLEDRSAGEMKQSFSSLFRQADQWVRQAAGINVTDASQVREMRLARETRLALREIRILGEKKRKELKEDSLKRGKAIDAIYRALELSIEPVESRMLEQEQFAERLEAHRLDELATKRTDELVALGSDPTFYNLREMPELVYQDLVTSARLAIENRKAAAAKAEADRIAQEKAEQEAREAQRIENERLKKELLEREALAKVEAEKAAKERQELEACAKAERDALEAKAKAERAESDRRAWEAQEKARIARKALEAKARKEREEAAAKAKVEAEKRQALERELAAKNKAEEDRKAAEAKAAKKAAAAPDRDKLLAVARQIRAIKIPPMSSQDGRFLANEWTRRLSREADSLEASAKDL